MTTLLRRVAALFHRSRLDRDLEDELQFHLEMREAARRPDAALADEGNRAAHIRFGSLALAKEDARGAWTFGWLERALQDARLTVRSLRRSPAFTTTAIATLAIGITATTVIFSVVDSLLFNPAPFRDAGRLVEFLRWSSRGGGPMQPAPMLSRWREQTQLFEQVEAHWESPLTLTGVPEPEIVWASQVTVGLLPMLGVTPRLGRSFTPDETSAPVALIAHRFWQRHLGGSPDALGRTVRLDDRLYTVVGVLSEQFRFPVSRVDLWVPFDPAQPNPWSPRGGLTPIARLRAGVPFDEADRQVAALAPLLDPTLAKMPVPGTTARLATLERYSIAGVRGEARSSVVNDTRTRLFLLFGAAIVLLLLSAANAANLFLSRALARVQELAVRAALGAGRLRLVRNTMMEAVVIAGCASLAGVIAASWIIETASASLPIEVIDGSLNPVNLDQRAVVWSAATATAAGILAALVPAFHILRRDLSRALKGHADLGITGRGGARGLLLLLQAAAAIVLLVVAGLMARSLSNVLNVDPGWSTEGVVIVEPRFGPSYRAPERRAAFMSDFTAAIREAPGFTAVAVAEAVPVIPSSFWSGTLEGEDTSLPDVEVMNIRVAPEYFQVLRLRFEQGRSFVADDDPQRAAVVSRTLAQQLWSGQSALGRSLRMGATGDWWTVVGVVGDVQMESVEVGREQMEIYRPLEAAGGNASFSNPYRYVVAKTDGGDGLATRLRQQARRIDPDLPIDIHAARDILRDTVAERELNTAFLVGFSVFGILLAAAGIYGVVAYDATRRTRELGIRMALGATAPDIVRLVVGRSLRLAAAGTAAGLVAASGVARFAASMVYGISPYDALTFGGAAVLLAGISVAAAAISARRALKADPIASLRTE